MRYSNRSGGIEALLEQDRLPSRVEPTRRKHRTEWPTPTVDRLGHLGIGRCHVSACLRRRRIDALAVERDDHRLAAQRLGVQRGCQGCRHVPGPIGSRAPLPRRPLPRQAHGSPPRRHGQSAAHPGTPPAGHRAAAPPLLARTDQVLEHARMVGSATCRTIRRQWERNGPPLPLAALRSGPCPPAGRGRGAGDPADAISAPPSAGSPGSARRWGMALAHCRARAAL